MTMPQLSDDELAAAELAAQAETKALATQRWRRAKATLPAMRCSGPLIMPTEMAGISHKCGLRAST
eukprot:11950817-Karenia_brevis.AAC.1